MEFILNFTDGKDIAISMPDGLSSLEIDHAVLIHMKTKGMVNVKYAHFLGHDFSNMPLNEVFKTLNRVDFMACKLKGTVMPVSIVMGGIYKCALDKTVFTHLDNVYFQEVDARNLDLSERRAASCIFRSCTFGPDTNFRNAMLGNATFEDCKGLTPSIFEGADIQGARFQNMPSDWPVVNFRERGAVVRVETPRV